jgi:hypothetical protein
MKIPGRWFGLAACTLVGMTTAVRAQVVDDKLQARINKAIDKGVEYLKAAQSPSEGCWRYGNDTPGATALAGWALLESGVPADDKAIQRAADYVRKDAVAMRKNYHISLALLFLDRLADARDVPLIESLAVRLLRGQTKDGGWSYDCGVGLAAAEQKRLRATIEDRKGAPSRPVFPRKFGDLDPAIQGQIKKLPAPQRLGGDNSNTQFAMIALYRAGRYGIPTKDALTRTAKRFLETQQPDGSWLYENVGPKRSAIGGNLRSHSMTCAGLLGIVLSLADDNNAKAGERVLNDPVVRDGFTHLGRILRGRITAGEDTQKTYYFLWSLERVGTAYYVKKILGKDWYEFGASFLVKSQDKGGSWQAGKYQGGVDTSFALLFLKRVNPLDDITDAFRNFPVGKEPGKKVAPGEEPPFELNPAIIEKRGATKKTSWLPARIDGPGQSCVSAISSARSSPIALLTVSSRSRSGTLSATMPAPACRYTVCPLSTSVRKAMQVSMLPLKST